MKADVCLVLEGTYPFVTGGVSSWVNRLVRQLSDLTFCVLHLSPAPNAYPDGPRYDLPGNVVGVQEVFLHGDSAAPPAGIRVSPKWRDLVHRFQRMMRDLRNDESGAFEAFFAAVNSAPDVEQLKRVLLASPDAWQVMLETYGAEAGKEGLAPFYWTWHFALLPLLNVLTAPLPDARCFHTVCTGYAGILAAGARAETGRPMVLTEHGIYTKERRIDIQRAAWIPEVPAELSLREAPYFRQFWTRQFEMMGRVCYRYADEIYTLYEGNRDQQIRDGADPDKVFVVPNGIDLTRFKVPESPSSARPYTIGFVGRICPIKDVRTLLRAARLVLDEMPEARFRIMGPYDEDPEYFEGCQQLADMLHLGDQVRFEGMVNVLQEVPHVDVCVLSSISEAQPLAVLEAGAFGIPSVATDVGSCTELLNGSAPEDRALGEGGLVVPIATPGALAEALLALGRDPDRRRAMGATMRTRVERYYDERDMVRRYGDIYRSHVGVPDVVGEAG